MLSVDNLMAEAQNLQIRRYFYFLFVRTFLFLDLIHCCLFFIQLIFI